MKFSLNRENLLKILKLNNAPSENSASPELVKAKKNIFLQAGLAFLTIVLTIIIIFSMTSAWYTNIVQTSGLIFEVESWGYSGEVEISEGPVYAGPGDSGVVELSVNGESEDILEVKVNVSKQAMNSEMKERIFFYVDTAETINNESVDRIYVNQFEDYEYTLFSKGSIVMKEDFSNVPALKWQWVYDVLGYYVLVDTSNEGFEIKDYLRPIEYDLDKATFAPATITATASDGTETPIDSKTIVFVEDGKTPTDFLEDFSRKDGYAGNISAENGSNYTSDGKTYYYVGEQGGYGIYAYLCDYLEIENATGFDTNLGNLARKKANNEPITTEEEALLKFVANVSVSVEQKQMETVEVSDLSALEDKISENSGEVIKLAADISVSAPLSVPAGSDVWIDLNGHTITGTVEGLNGAIEAESGSSLTLMNGKVSGESESKRGIEAVGAELNLSNVDMEGFEYGVYIGDNFDANAGDSVVRMTDCEMDAGFVTVFISGNGVLSEEKTKLIIEDCTLKSAGYVISGNGTVADGGGRWGTDIQVINTTIISSGTTEDNETWGTGIYHPQKDSNLTIYNCDISGPMGIVIKGGFVDIIDSRIAATGDFYKLEVSKSGFSNTGDAIYIEANYGYGIGLTIKETGAADKDGKPVITSVSATGAGTQAPQALRVFGEYSERVSVEIISGVFSPALTDESWISADSVAETSGDKTTVTEREPETAE